MDLPPHIPDVLPGIQENAEGLVRGFVQWLRLGVETIGAVLVALGVVLAAIQLVRGYLAGHDRAFTTIRLTLARYLALALEFQLGADILTTAVAPTWDEIGKLGAIAVIRTGLNFFLSKEMEQEKREREAERAVNAESNP